jgi:hypothetical protein
LNQLLRLQKKLGPVSDRAAEAFGYAGQSVNWLVGTLFGVSIIGAMQMDWAQ